MPKFSNKSKERLESCHPKLQDLFNEVIKYFDCAVVCGNRTKTAQFELFKIGRKFVSDKWVIVDKENVKTHKDGFDKPGKHNTYPSIAVDVVPFVDGKPTWNMWQAYYFAGHVKMMASLMGMVVRCGADWDNDNDVNDQGFKDPLHFELIV